MTKVVPYILIADDDPEDLQMLASDFRRQNPVIDIACVQDGQQALSFLVGQDTSALPVMIIADYKMPLLTGAELFRLLQPQEKYHNITKIIWSTSRDKTHIDECLNNGADKYIIKPAEVAELTQIVNDLTELCKYAIIRSAADIDSGSLNDPF